MDIAELVDRTLITDLLHAYCDRVDRSDIDGLMTLFADDIEIDMGRGATFTGHPALRALLVDRTGRWATTSHHSSTMSLLHYDGATATTTSYLYVLHDDPARDEAMHLWGRYDDGMVKQDGTWRFRTRRLRVAGVSHAPSTPLPDRFERRALS